MSILRRSSIKTRFYMLVTISLATLALASALTTSILESTLYDFKKNGISQVVMASVGVAEHFFQLQEKGELTEAQAQHYTKEALRKVRFDNGNYINIFTGKGVGVMHPTIEPGRDMTFLKDKDGSPIVLNHIRSVRNPEGEGFNYYWWPKPGEEKIYKKFSFNKRFAPWDWIFSAGDFEDAITKVVSDSIKASVIVLAVTAMSLGAVSLAVMRSILSPLSKTVASMNHITREKLDLTTRINDDGRDELSDLAKNFNRLQVEVQEVIKDIGHVNRQVNSSAAELVGIANRTRQGTDRQSKEMDQIVTSVHEMSATVNEIANNTAHASEITNKTNQAMSTGKENINGTVISMNTLVERIASSSDTLADLLITAQKINTVLEVINGVAEQTNLLALNAAIEAARAGEQGRGFAVVADEVRTLARRVQESTHEIDEIIQQIHASAKDASDSMQVVVDVAQTTNEKTRKTGDALENVILSVGKINDLNTQIATAAEQQAFTTNQISRNLMDINSITHDSADDVHKIKTATDNLYNISSRMAKAIDRFIC